MIIDARPSSATAVASACSGRVSHALRRRLPTTMTTTNARPLMSQIQKPVFPAIKPPKVHGGTAGTATRASASQATWASSVTTSCRLPHWCTTLCFEQQEEGLIAKISLFHPFIFTVRQISLSLSHHIAELSLQWGEFFL